MTNDDRLREALSLGPDTPQAIDYGFAARVAERIERLRLGRRMAVSALWASVAALLGWVLARSMIGVAPDVMASVRLLLLSTVLIAAIWLLARASALSLVGRSRRTF